MASDLARQKRNREEVERDNATRAERDRRPVPALMAPLEYGGPWLVGEERRLIFENVANGVPMENIKAAFLRSEEEVWREVEFVALRIKVARFKKHQPPLECQGIRAIRINRRALLETLERLPTDYLATELALPRVGLQDLDTPGILKEAAEHVRARVTGL